MPFYKVLGENVRSSEHFISWADEASENLVRASEGYIIAFAAGNLFPVLIPLPLCLKPLPALLTLQRLW